MPTEGEIVTGRWRWLAVGMSYLLALGSAGVTLVVVLHLADVPPLGFRGIRVWESPVLAAFAGAVLLMAIGGGVAVAQKLRRGKLAVFNAFVFSVVFTLVALAANLVVLGSSAVAYTPVAQLLSEVEG